MAADATVEVIAPVPVLLCGDSGVIVAAPPPTLLAGTVGCILSAPPPTLSSNDGNVARLTAPPPTLSSSWDYQTALTAPVPTLSAFMNDGCQLTAPVPTLNAYTGHSAALIAPTPLLTATALGGGIHTAALFAPAPTLIAVDRNPSIITAVNAAPLPALIATGFSSGILTAALVAPAPTLATIGISGNKLTALLTAATPILVAAGYPAYTLTFAGTAPVPQITAYLNAPTTVAFRTWVLNTRKGALTEYGSEFAFNSYATFRGQVLACGAGGVVVLGTQATDNGTAIDALARTGKNDYDRSQLKRVPRIYTGYQSDGDMIFRTITSETGRRSYLLPCNHVIGFQQRRIPVGKGPKSTYWQYEWANVAGSDFTIEHLLTYPTMLRRRIQ